MYTSITLVIAIESYRFSTHPFDEGQCEVLGKVLGFSLQVYRGASQSDKLERLCRYISSLALYRYAFPASA